jgi:hypothetical protein|tara:strand:- start:102 stop:551 length:450 start_codon:yes stop_codon:yes gene_type:complete
MAELTTTITESVILNGSVRGSSNVLTTSDIVDVYERILTLAHSNTTTIVTFGSSPHSSAGAVDVENAKYVRVTNLSTTDDMILAFVTSGTNYQVTVRAGGSHVLYQAEDAVLGEADSTPAFSGLADVVTIQAKPSATTDVQCEIFIALV